MTQQPIDYASRQHAKARSGKLAAASLLLSLGGIVAGLGLFAIGALIGFGARGGGPGIPVAAAGLILVPVLNFAAFITGIVALFRKCPNKAKAIIGTALSGVILVLPLLILLAILVLNHLQVR